MTGGGLTPPPVTDPATQIIDKRRWTSLKATVGSVEFVGIDGITIRADNLVVAINQASGSIVDQSLPTPVTTLNTKVVAYDATPLTVKTGPAEVDRIVKEALK